MTREIFDEFGEMQLQLSKFEKLLEKYEKKVEGKYFKEDAGNYVILLAPNGQYIFNNISKEYPMRFIDTFTKGEYDKLRGIYRNLNYSSMDKTAAYEKYQKVRPILLDKKEIDFDNLFTEKGLEISDKK